MWTAIGLKWGLQGLWVGVTVALIIVTLAELVFLVTADWQKFVDEADSRNSHVSDREP